MFENVIQRLERERIERVGGITKPKSREVSDWESRISQNTPAPLPEGQLTPEQKIDKVSRLQQIYGDNSKPSEPSGDGSIPLNGAQVLRKAIGALAPEKKSTAQVLGEALRGHFNNQ